MRGAGERVGCRGLPGCSIMRAFLPFANIGVLRAGRAQPLYLLTPAGRFALRATAHRADAPLRRAHGFAALANIGVLCAAARSPCICSRLQVALGLWPKCPPGTRFPARLPGFGAESQKPVPQHKTRALRAPKGRKKRGTPHLPKSPTNAPPPHQKNRPPPHKRERAATRPAGSIRQTDSPSDTAATRAGCRRCPQRPGT